VTDPTVSAPPTAARYVTFARVADDASRIPDHTARADASDSPAGPVNRHAENARYCRARAGGSYTELGDGHNTAANTPAKPRTSAPAPTHHQRRDTPRFTSFATLSPKLDQQQDGRLRPDATAREALPHARPQQRETSHPETVNRVRATAPANHDPLYATGPPLRAKIEASSTTPPNTDDLGRTLR
jgi:hypothetical protein